MNISFEDTGLFAGLIAYSYHINGKEFYQDEFKNSLFDSYRDNSKNMIKEKADPHIYLPYGYHLLGNYNLAVLSLVDGYAFGNRVFHQGNGYRNGSCDKYNYTYQVITGIGYDKNNEKNYLITKARQTFLKTTERFPFIAITRYKLSNKILIGSGMKLLVAIREVIGEIYSGQENTEAIVLDCFGNNELTVISFSDSLEKLYQCIKETKKLEVLDSPADKPDPESGNVSITRQTESNQTHSHIIAASYTYYGYDIDWDDSSGKFLSPQEDEHHTFNFRWEIKSGHEDAFCDTITRIKDLFSTAGKIEIRKAMSGAHSLYVEGAPFRLKKFREFMEMTCPSDRFKQHTRKLKLQFFHKENYDLKSDPLDDPSKLKAFFQNEDASSTTNPDLGFTIAEINTIRDQLRQCGIPKLTKERLLKTFARFNECVRDKQFYIYFIELRDFLCGIQEAIANWVENPAIPINEIDEYLTIAIADFEYAYNNRFHQSTRIGSLADTTLEYNGGIQQYVTSFDLIYKLALQSLDFQTNHNYNRPFLYISGFENVVSKREVLRINMNLITYPELFATSVYKEASNFIFNRHDYKNTPENKYVYQFPLWEDIAFRNKIPEKLVRALENSTAYNPRSYSHRVIRKISNQIIKYFIADIHNLYFGFNNDIDLFEYYYWKYSLQISYSYERNGEFSKNYFISLLLRLFCVRFFHGIYSRGKTPEQITKEIEALRYKPFDPQLSNLWFSHYKDVLILINIIWKELSENGFDVHLKEMIGIKIHNIVKSEYMAFLHTQEIFATAGKGVFTLEDWITHKHRPAFEKQYQKDALKYQQENPEQTVPDVSLIPETINFYQSIRTYEIDKMRKSLRQHLLIQEEGKIICDPGFIFNILTAYLYVIKDLSNNKKPKTPVIHILPRDARGKIIMSDTLTPHFTALLSDPQGGFFPYGNVSKEYFAIRTALYKSIWDYAMKRKKEMLKENKKATV